MGFPDNVLADGERVEKSLHPHWMTVFGPILLGAVLLVGSLWVVAATPDDGKGNLIQWIVIVLAVLLAIPFVVVPLLVWRTTHYVITSHRVMVRKGVLNKMGKDITLSKITDVSFRQSLFDRIMNAGSLNIESAGDSPDEMLRFIPRSNEIQQLINRLIDQDDLRRRAVEERLIRRDGTVAGTPGASPTPPAAAPPTAQPPVEPPHAPHELPRDH